MHPVDLALAAAFALAWPAFGTRVERGALRAAVAAGARGARRAAYLGTMFMQWTFAALTAAAALEFGRGAEALRLVPPRGFGIAIAVVAVGAVAFLLFSQRRAVATPAGRAAVRRAVGPLAWFLPHDRADRATFRTLSLTAGMCEEWLFRGWLVAVFTPLVGVAGAFAISTALFGLAHAYQGPRGIVNTGLVGLGLAGLAWSTGSLWAPIVVHAMADWMQGDLITAALEEPEAEVGTVAAA
jgi:membrane protease YdiL (CAAX protease family)